MQTDVKKQIETILADHKITTDSTSIKNKRNQKPTPIDREIKLDPSRTIMSKTDARGVIEYANDYFMEICGYEEYELMGQPHSIIRHPDMPKVIFSELWKRLNKGENIHAFVKNLAKDGRYYWVLTNFETKYDESGAIISHYARRKAAPGNAIYQIEKLYKTLKSIEDTQGIEVAERYFSGLLEEKNMNYNEFILEILGINEKAVVSYFIDSTQTSKPTKKRSVFGRLFG